MSHESASSLIQSQMVPRVKHESYQDQEVKDRVDAAILASEAMELTLYGGKQFAEVRHTEQLGQFTGDSVTNYSIMRQEAPLMPDGSSNPFEGPTFSFNINKSVTQGMAETPGTVYVKLGLDGEVKHAYIEEYSADKGVLRYDMSNDPKSEGLTNRGAIDAAAEVLAVIKPRAEAKLAADLAAV